MREVYNKITYIRINISHECAHLKFGCDWRNSPLQSKIPMEKRDEAHHKWQYLLCKRKPGHEDEYLNYVCLDRNCPQRGLICSLCKEDHPTHPTLPLKYLLSALKNHHEDPLQDSEYSHQLEQIENIKNSMLHHLKLTVQALALQFQQLEQSMLDLFSAVKVELLEQIQLNMEFQQIVGSALTNKIADEKEYVQDFRRIAGAVQLSGREVKFKIRLDEVVENYKQAEQHLYSQLINIESHVKKEIDRQIHIKPEKIPQNTQIVKSPPSPKLYRFSNIYRAPSIQLSDGGKIARQTETATTRFVIIPEGKGLRNKSITFRVPKLQNWVGVGVCAMDKIAKVNYHFKYQNLQHGSYLLSNNGYTWSNSEKEENVHACHVSFHQGNSIKVTLTETALHFLIKETGDKVTLKVHFKEEEWPNVCFCANLCSAEDSIEIVDP